MGFTYGNRHRSRSKAVGFFQQLGKLGKSALLHPLKGGGARAKARPTIFGPLIVSLATEGVVGLDVSVSWRNLTAACRS